MPRTESERLRLTTERGEFDHPDAEAVDAALEALFGSQCDFVILARADEDYVQSAGGQIEYRDGERHWRAAEMPASDARIREVFHAYLSGDEETLAQVRWIDVTEEVSGRSVSQVNPSRWIFPIALISLLLGLLLLAFAGWGPFKLGQE